MRGVEKSYSGEIKKGIVILVRSGFKFRIHSNKIESYLVLFSLFFSLRMQINVFRG